ncbi:hypothetical protein O6H91_03G016300 [Diphasiastrum complanatum]|uniref:Uncharacterized protein n=1 Tax=Diphasiastrum complanatum TaxID=34168 RepID=A0ACC2E3Q1_DIPCM|nr:hypothetical protein O6H91_03G016300 [Diphasiastrum complanatum]
MHENNTAHERSHGEESKQHQQHTKSVMPILTALKFFLKGGRRISIGDCALFQAGKAPPFIGILRNASLDKEGVVKLAVNWLYRPADVKLAKGASFEAAPNEIFYSFHKDDIPATALLHPCRVAFLPKGVELPSGVSSFVCRRVYDTTNKRLWWLTDKDYTDEHQQEVDLLLGRIEMQAAVQTEIPSPKALAGPSFQQVKGSAENAQAPAVAAAKGKKRERVDNSLEPSKRERLVKPEDSELNTNKQDCSMRADDISALTDKDGSILNLACVDKLIDLMRQEWNDGVKKLSDLANRRSLLAGVIAATDREDCLNRFVQLGGLPVLDDWLQEAHKGKVGDGGSPKDGDKVFEDLLLILLRALDKLPVNLDALKTCIVGKSVNNLRSHKNFEIQKKARKLVDIWKKTCGGRDEAVR